MERIVRVQQPAERVASSTPRTDRSDWWSPRRCVPRTSSHRHREGEPKLALDSESTATTWALSFRRNNKAYNEKKIRHECVGERPTYLVWKQSH